MLALLRAFVSRHFASSALDLLRGLGPRLAGTAGERPWWKCLHRSGVRG